MSGWAAALGTSAPTAERPVSALVGGAARPRPRRLCYRRRGLRGPPPCRERASAAPAIAGPAASAHGSAAGEKQGNNERLREIKASLMEVA
eukprot:3632721-Pyramimonas_sp.AAC.1